MKQNYIKFREHGKQYTWFYENMLGENGLVEGLRELYSCWSVTIEKVVIGGKADEMWIDYL